MTQLRGLSLQVTVFEPSSWAVQWLAGCLSFIQLRSVFILIFDLLGAGELSS
jgi:hypothetical protein